MPRLGNLSIVVFDNASVLSRSLLLFSLLPGLMASFLYGRCQAVLNAGMPLGIALPLAGEPPPLRF